MSFINYLKSKRKLIVERKEAECKTIESEKKKHFEEKKKIILDYENRIIRECRSAADEREKEIMAIVEQKDARIRDLELEIISLKNMYRDFKQEVQDHAVLMEVLNTEIQAGMHLLTRLAAKFTGMHHSMGRVQQRIDKKDIRIIEAGKS